MMAVDATLVDKEMALIEGRYTIPDPAEVRRMLAGRAEVRQVLIDASTVIRKTFGSRLRGIVLEVVPDYDEGEDLLGATVLVRATPRAALELRTGLDDWWLTCPAEARLTVALGVAPV